MGCRVGHPALMQGRIKNRRVSGCACGWMLQRKRINSSLLHSTCGRRAHLDSCGEVHGFHFYVVPPFGILDELALILLGEVVCVKKFCCVETKAGGAG